MASLPISTGSRLKRLPAEHAKVPGRGILHAAACGALCALSAHAPTSKAQQPDLLLPERAFAFSVRATDPGTVEARFAIADGYYLYRDKLRFSVDPDALAVLPTLPPGKMKHDEFFGNVETYRGRVVVKLPLAQSAPGNSVTVKAESQGCADIGVCYPPQAQKVTLTLPAVGAPPGAPVEASPARKSWFN